MGVPPRLSRGHTGSPAHTLPLQGSPIRIPHPSMGSGTWQLCPHPDRHGHPQVPRGQQGHSGTREPQAGEDQRWQVPTVPCRVSCLFPLTPAFPIAAVGDGPNTSHLRMGIFGQSQQRSGKTTGVPSTSTRQSCHCHKTHPPSPGKHLLVCTPSTASQCSPGHGNTHVPSRVTPE